ncbi:MAG: DNA-3-methyladenine glycosylase 2 family protein [Thermoplasmata archaeon]|nr:MAG: DNA-3-methyladenine glycosylase 2 family protein [Thermoplasmata archaeon]
MSRVSLPWPVHRGEMRLDVPFDLGVSLLCGQAFRWQPLDDGGYRGVVEGTVVDIWQPSEGRLRWESGPMALEKKQVTSYFRLDDDLEAIREAISDVSVDGAFTQYPGLRILRQEPWETLISFVISQVSNVPRISRTVETLSMHYGDHLGDGLSASFPRPEQLAQADENALRLLGLGYRAPHLVHISNAVNDGQLFLEPLRFASFEEARARLMELPGVGPKVADCALLFSLDHLEAFPVDRWVIRAVEEWFDVRKGMSQEAIADWARTRFGQYAGYAGQYLFHARREGGAECPAPGDGRRRGPVDLDRGNVDVDLDA